MTGFFYVFFLHDNERETVEINTGKRVRYGNLHKNMVQFSLCIIFPKNHQCELQKKLSQKRLNNVIL